MLTLIGENMAKKGMKFVFEKADDICNTCKLRFTCTLNLEKGRVYEIVDVKKIKHFCPKEDNYLVLVEIVEPLLEVAIESRKAIEGMIVEYIIPCNKRRCKNWGICVPIGLDSGNKIIVKKVRGAMECPLGSRKVVEAEGV
ncbi:MAG: UPF0179 family protein [Candidatus Methanofastidiosia archaeon]